MIKIGISTIGYECSEHFDEVLEPWLSKDIKAEVIISAAHGVFPETHKLGFPIYSTDGTIQRLIKAKEDGRISNVAISDEPIYERDLRNSTLPFLLDKNIDFLWLLDLQDEIYTVEQINKIIKHVQESKSDWFKINFKNYVFDEKTYVDDFVAPRIWKNSSQGGIAGFYYDNDIVFRNSAPAKDLPNEIIPREIAFVKHLSWVGSESYLKRKINFQKIHYGQCSYAWDELNQKLALDEEYYLRHNKAKPITYKD